MKLSASRLTTFDQCQQKYHFSYHLRLPRPVINTRTALGIIVHKTLEIFYRDFRYQATVLPTKEWLSECYERAWQEHGKNVAADEYDKLWHSGWQGLISYYQRHISTDGGQTGRFESPFLVEQKFRARVMVQNNWLTLTGQIDRLDWLDYDKVTLRLVEYKTTKRVPTEAIDARFKVQLGFYQWAIQQVYGYGLKEVSFHYVLAEKEVTYQCKPEYREMIEQIAGLAIEQEDFDDDDARWPAKTGDHCLNCDYRRYCSAVNPNAEKIVVKRRPKQLRLF